MVMDVLGVGDVWKVPEMGSNNVMSCVGIMAKNNNGKEFEGRSENWKLEQREASVLRYKEKRQNRLFSKRIRYQVRKLNAEKRPRMKVIIITSTYKSCFFLYNQTYTHTYK